MTGITGRVAPGVRIGDYLLERELPSAATEHVFAASHTLLPRRVRFVIASSAEDASQLIREACIIEALRHPAIPRIYECGRLPDRRPWIAVELVNGPTLAELTIDQPLTIAEVIEVLHDVATVLDHAHARGVIHHGICAEAIARCFDGLRLFEWSAATLAHGQHPFDFSGDIHALGMVAYQALTSALPTMPAVRRCPGAPVRLTSLIDRMLAASPSTGPTAADVRAEAALLTERAEPVVVEDDGTPIEQVEVVLVDISREPPPVPRQAKLKWTPAEGYLSNATPIAAITPARKKTP